MVTCLGHHFQAEDLVAMTNDVCPAKHGTTSMFENPTSDKRRSKHLLVRDGALGLAVKSKTASMALGRGVLPLLGCTVSHKMTAPPGLSTSKALRANRRPNSDSGSTIILRVKKTKSKLLKMSLGARGVRCVLGRFRSGSHRCELFL